jgi:hypothetical protein
VESSATALVFPWRQLGELLVDERLLTPTELEIALEEQRRTGRLLGQIVVEHGFVSAFSLARVLSAQHGVELHTEEEPEEEAHLAAVPANWRPLGRLLVEKGLVTQTQLADALLAQTSSQRLGELLVQRELISAGDLARALTEQHGLELTVELEAELKPAPAAEPVYRVYSVTFRQGFQEKSQLWEHANFLEAADFAMEHVQDNEPEALEIERVNGVNRETVWTYSASRAAAASLAQRDLVDTFGFDPTKWGRAL